MAINHNFGVNPLTRLWQKLSSNALLASKLSKFVKLVEIAAVIVMGLVEDERTFYLKLHEV